MEFFCHASGGIVACLAAGSVVTRTEKSAKESKRPRTEARASRVRIEGAIFP